MCTLILSRQPDARWPVLIAANRDEMADRPWLPPARHWPDRPNVIAGLDQLGDGSWLGMNDDGLVAAVMNREGTLGPAPGMRSRGELVLEALDHAEAFRAAEALLELNPVAYRAFNLVVADSRQAFWIVHRGNNGKDAIAVHEIPPGLSMFTAGDRNSPESARIRAYLPRFQAADTPNPESDTGWTAWESLLASRTHDVDCGPEGAMTVVMASGFGTISSSLIALPEYVGDEHKPVWRFAPGRPGETPYAPVSLAAAAPRESSVSR